MKKRRISHKELSERAEAILRFCQEQGYCEQTTAFACVLAAAALAGEDNKRELMSFMASVFDFIKSEAA